MTRRATTSAQTTVSAPVRLDGVGVHSGASASVTVRPASVDHGIAFRRVDLDGPVLPALHHLVTDTSLCTVLGDRATGVSTIEHLMAALRALGVDNALVEVDGPEMPIMDGSSRPFIDAIEAVGLTAQNRTRRVIRVLKPITVQRGDAVATLRPADNFRIDATIEFDHSAIGTQSLVYDEAADDFTQLLSRARTFGLYSQYEAAKARGLARGSSFENTIVLGETAVMNESGLRYADEFVRHKVLDAVGDLALAGFPIIGEYRVTRPGHGLNNAILTELFSTPGAWVLVNDSDEAAGGVARAGGAVLAPIH